MSWPGPIGSGLFYDLGEIRPIKSANALSKGLFREGIVINRHGNIGQCVGWKRRYIVLEVIETGRNDHFVLDSDQRNSLPSAVGSRSSGRGLGLPAKSAQPIEDIMRISSLSRYLLGSCLAVLLCLSPALGQTVTGSITGQVTDPSGAVVVGATVTAENTATGVKTSAKTNASGVYTIRFLPIGTYKATIEANGFVTESVQEFSLEIDQTAKIDGHLTIGTSSTVVVQADFHPILDTSDATLGNTLSTNEIQNIPLNGRNFSSLTLFQPGSVATDPNGLTGNNAIERNTYNSGVVTVNGNRQQANNYMVEGADNNEPQNNLIGYNPAPDAIAGTTRGRRRMPTPATEMPMVARSLPS